MHTLNRRVRNRTHGGVGGPPWQRGALPDSDNFEVAAFDSASSGRDTLASS
jgi:hypothetical protein